MQSAAFSAIMMSGAFVLPPMSRGITEASGGMVDRLRLAPHYSGMAASAQDAGTAFWNPAAMPLLPGMQAAAAVHYIKSSFDFTSAGPPPAGSTFNALGDGGDAGGGEWAPALRGTLAISPRLSAGLAVNAPFGSARNGTMCGQAPFTR